MKGILYSLVSIATMLLPSMSWALPAAKVTASIDSTVIEMGARANITIDISDPSMKGVLVDLPEPGVLTDAVDIVSVEADTFAAGYQYRVCIQAFEPGDITFEPFRFAVGDDTTQSTHLSLKVIPVELDSLETINPMTGVANVPRKWYDYIPDYLLWIVLSVALLAVVVALIVLYRKNGTIIIKKVKPVDPYEEAMSSLNNLRERKLAETGREKEFYTSLIDILRKYLDGRYGINAMEMTSTQILATLKANPETRDNQPRIKQILEIADFVKFANVRPLPDDNVNTFRNVVKFVEDTKPVVIEADEANGDDKKDTQTSVNETK